MTTHAQRKIIITYNTFGLGGAQRRASILANSFAQNGYSVIILAISGKENPSDDVSFYPLTKGVTLVLLPDYIAINKKTYSYKWFCTLEYGKQLYYRALRAIACWINVNAHNNYTEKLRSLSISRDIKYFLKKHKEALIIHFGFNVFDKIYYATRNSKNKIIFAETNAIDKYKNDSNFGLIQNQLQTVDAYVFQTEEEKQVFSLDKSKLAKVIHNPLAKELPERYYGERRKTIVTFCRMVPQKNLFLLTRAFYLLLQDYPDYSLHIYADADKKGRESTWGQIEAYIKDKGIESSVRLFQAVPNVHELVRDCKMFVSSSDYEGLSNSMIEAMAIGLPCVCTDCNGGGAREMIRDGENGILTPIGDIDALYLGMKRMIEDPEFAERCSNYSSIIRDKLSVLSISEEWLSVIKEVENGD